MLTVTSGAELLSNSSLPVNCSADETCAVQHSEEQLSSTQMKMYFEETPCLDAQRVWRCDWVTEGLWERWCQQFSPAADDWQRNSALFPENNFHHSSALSFCISALVVGFSCLSAHYCARTSQLYLWIRAGRDGFSDSLMHLLWEYWIRVQITGGFAN